MVLIIIAAIIALVFFIGYKREKEAQKNRILEAFNNFGQANKRKITAEEMKAIRSFSDRGESIIDELTWNDLDMNLIYKNINYCFSSSGDEQLYNMLRNPHTCENDWDDFEKKTEGIRSDEKLRRSLTEALYKMGRTGRFDIYTYIDCLENADFGNVKADYVLDLLYIVAIALCFANILLGVGFFFLIMVINIGSYFKKKRKIEPYIVCFKYIYRVLVNSELLTEIDGKILENELTDLDSTLVQFKQFKRFSSIVLGDLGASPIGVAFDYLKMLTHMDLIKFESMLKIVLEHKKDIVHILEIIGRIDCYQSIASYRAFVKNYCVPELSDKKDGICIVEGYHPLLKSPVANSITTNVPVLLTGSNASGKSTFLKMVAINAILAQSIHTCLAKEYRAPYYVVYSSLSLKDNITEGDSYYMAEIKALKRIMDAATAGKPVLGFVDEILRGTNTTERVAASSAILRNLSENNVLVFAATHDIELTSILTEYDNYHFEEKMVGSDIQFSYELLEGKAVSRNAIKLLEIMGYDEKIIAGSRALVDKYEKSGNWS